MTRNSSATARNNSFVRAAMWTTMAAAFAIGLIAPAAATTGVFGSGSVAAVQQPIGEIQVPGNGWGG